MLFNELCLSWLEFKKCTVKASTIATYRRTVMKRIIPVLGDIDCRKLSENTIVDFINDMSNSQLSDKTVQDTVVILKGIMKFGNVSHVMNMNLELIPCPKVFLKNVDVLSSGEIELLLSYMEKHVDMRNLGIYLGLYAGMRLGEVCALLWENIDLDNKVIHVNATMQRIYIDEKHTEVIIMNTKTHHSMRDIPIIDSLYCKLCHNCQHHGYVLTLNHKCFEPRNMQRYFKGMMMKLGIDKNSFHVLRHTFATRCVQCDMDIKSLSEILGHSNVNITLNRYVHSSFEMKYEQIQKLCY